MRSTIGGQCARHGPYDAMHASCPYCAQEAYKRTIAAYKMPTVKRRRSRRTAPALPLGYLVIRHPSRWRGAVAQVRSGVTIGQHMQCGIRLPEPQIAAWHAQIQLHREGNQAQFYIRDLGSPSGTYVNGRRLTTSVWLFQDDVVRVGSYEFEFKTLFN